MWSRAPKQRGVGGWGEGASGVEPRCPDCHPCHPQRGRPHSLAPQSISLLNTTAAVPSPRCWRCSLPSEESEVSSRTCHLSWQAGTYHSAISLTASLDQASGGSGLTCHDPRRSLSPCCSFYISVGITSRAPGTERESIWGCPAQAPGSVGRPMTACPASLAVLTGGRLTETLGVRLSGASGATAAHG